MKKREDVTAKVASSMTSDDRTYQHNTLLKYRTSGVIPDSQSAARESGTSLSTIISFFHGNSPNKFARAYIRKLMTEKFDPLPKDLQKLFDIWERDSNT